MNFQDIQETNLSDLTPECKGISEPITSTGLKPYTVTPEDGYRFIMNLRKACETYLRANIIHHNDMDGFAGGLLARELLTDLGYDIGINDVRPVSHVEKNKINYRDDTLYFFVDMQPPASKEEEGVMTSNVPENFFCADHHKRQDRMYIFDEQFFIFSPANVQNYIPPTGAMLASYLYYINQKGHKDLITYCQDFEWEKFNNFQDVIYLATVADHLYLFTQENTCDMIRRAIKRASLSEENYIKLSIAVSLVMGKEDTYDRIERFSDFYKMPLTKIDTSLFFNSLSDYIPKINNLFSFVNQVVEDSVEFIMLHQRQLEEKISSLKESIERDEKTLESYKKAMPRLNKDTKEWLEYAKAVKQYHEPGSSKAKELEFYSREIEKLETRMSSNAETVEKLEKKMKKSSLTGINGIAVFIPQQSSTEVKGIMSSLFYYFNFRNIVFEEREEKAIWGSRGFVREQLDKFLTTLTIDKKVMAKIRMQEGLYKQFPGLIGSSVNISDKVKLEQTYMGGMGGRGKIFGGVITGRVPQLYSFLGSGDLEKKLQDLLNHRQLGGALMGLTEGGDSLIPTFGALRTKFKSRNWVTVQVLGGAKSGEVMKGGIEMVVSYLMNNTQEMDIKLEVIEEI